MDKAIQKRLEALEGAAGERGLVVAFCPSADELARIVEQARLRGQRVVHWPLRPPPIERTRLQREVDA